MNKRISFRQPLFRSNLLKHTRRVFFSAAKKLQFKGSPIRAGLRTRTVRKQISSRRATLIVLGISVVMGMGINLARPAQTGAATSTTINFQARLETIGGAVVPDGTYNVEFNLYNAVTGGTSEWTEDYLVGSSTGITVVNGYLTANLGSINNTLMSSGINWDQQQWLTMDIGGTSGSVVAYSTSHTGWDGEMSPRLQITAVPYAFRAGQLADPANSGSTLTWATQGAAHSLLLPNEAGTLCTNAVGGACSALGFYIQNQNLSPQTGAYFDIAGSGTAATSFISPIFTSAAALAVTAGTNLTLTATGANTASLDTSTSGGTVSIAFTAGTLNVATGTGVQSLYFGTGGTGAKTVTIGSTASTSSTLIQAGSGGISLTGNTSVTGANTLTVGTGATSLGGNLTVAGTAYISGNLSTDNGGISGISNSASATAPTGIAGGVNNLAVNSSFETGDLTGWTPSGTWAIDNTNSKYGSDSAEATGTGSSQQTLTGTCIPVDNTDYVLSTWAKSNDGLQKGYLGLKYYSNTNCSTLVTNNYPTTMNGTNVSSSWTRYYGVINPVTQSAGTLAVRIYFHGSYLTAGNTWFDGIQLERGTVLTAWKPANTDSGSGSQNLFGIGAGDTIVYNPITNSTATFQIQNASGSADIFTVDTTNGKVGTQNQIAASTNSSNLVIQSGTVTGTTSNSGNVTLDSGAATGTAGSVSIGTGTYAHNVTIGNATGNSAVTLQSGTGAITLTPAASGTILIGAAAQTGAITLGSSTGINSVSIAAGTGAATVNIANSTSDAATVGIGSSNASTAITLQGGAGKLVVNNSGTTFTGLATANGGLAVTTANGLTLGTSSSSTGGIVFKGSGGTGTLTLAGPLIPNTGNYTLTIPAITANANVCTDNSVCAGYAPSTGGSYLAKGAVDTSSAAVTALQGDLYTFTNSSSGIASGVLSLVNSGTNSALSILQSGTSEPPTGQALILANNNTTTPTGNLLDLQNKGVSELHVDVSGNVTALGTYNTNTFTGSALTFGTAGTATIQSNAGNLSLQAGGAHTASLDSSASGGTATLGATNANTVTVGNSTTATVITLQGGATTETINNTGAAIGGTPANSVLTIGTNTTSNTGGITFGTDTNLYRSGTSTLQTDSALVINSTSNPQIALNVSPTINTSTGNARFINAEGTFTGSGGGPGGIGSQPTFSPSANLSVAYGFINIAKGSPGAGITITTLDGGFNRIDTGSTGGAVTTANTLYVSAPSLGSVMPGTITGVSVQNQGASGVGTAIGVDVAAQTGATTNNIGLRVAASSMYSLQLSGTAGTASNGIEFGTDTNLYRSAANVLTTDDSLTVGTNLTVQGTGSFTLASGTGLSVTSNATVGGTLVVTGTINTATISGGTLTTSAVNSLNVGANAISTSSGNLTVDANGTGQVQIGGNSTGDVLLAGGSGATGCTVTNATGALTCAGNITGAATGTIGYFTRSGTTLQPATAGDNIQTTSAGTITSAGLLTGSAGLTITGATNLNSGTSAGSVGIGNNTGNTSISIDSGTAAINIGTGAQARTVSIGTGAAAETVNLGSNNAGSSVNLTAGNTTQNLTSSGDIIQSAGANSTTAFQVQNATAEPIFVVDTTNNNLVTNPGFEVNTTGWATDGSGTGLAIAQYTASKANVYLGQAALQVTTANGTANTGTKTTSFTSALTSATTYTLSFYVKASSSSFTTLKAGRADNGSTETACTLNSTSVSTSGFQQYSCTFTTGTVSGSPYIFITTSDSTQHVFWVDAVQLTTGSSVTPYQIGNIQLRGVVSSPVVFESTSNSTTALQVQNAAGTSNLLVADTLDNVVGIGLQPSSTGSTLQVGGSLSTTGNISLTGSSPVTIQSTATNGILNVDANGAGTLNLDTTGAGVVSIATNATTITVGGSGANAIAIGNTQTGGSIALGGALTTGSITVGSTAMTTGTTTIQGGTNGVKVATGTGGSTTAFQVQNAAGNAALLNVDNQNLRVSVGSIGTATEQLYVGGQLPTSAVSSTTTSASPWSVYVQNNYAYTLNNGTSFQVIDVSTPSSPVVKSTTAVPGATDLNGLFVAGRYAYLADGGAAKVFIYDISNPSVPSLISTVATASANSNIFVAGRYMYVGDSTGLQVVDISNPANPVVFPNFTTVGGINGIYVQGIYAYVGNGAGKLSAINVSNPSSPSLASTSTSTGVYYVYVQGRYAYTEGSTDNNLQIFDVSNPSSLSTPVGNATTGSSYAGSTGFPFGIYIQGRYAYTVDGSASGAGKIYVTDISNPASPTVVGNISTGTGSNPLALFVQGNELYTTDYGNSKLLIYDVGGTYSQQLSAGGIETGTLDVDSNATVQGTLTVGSGLIAGGNSQFSGNVGINGSTQIATNSNNAFQVQTAGASSLLNVDTNNLRVSVGTGGTATSQLYVAGSQPSAALYTGTITGAGVQDIVTNGRYMYVAEFNTSKLATYDISNPLAPVLIGTPLSLAGEPQGMTIGGKYLYIADYSPFKMQVIDISNPGVPAAITGGNSGLVSITSNGNSITVLGDYAYVATSSGVDVINVSNPATPTEVINNGISIPGVTAMSVFGAGRYVYATTSNSGTNAFMKVIDTTTNTVVGTFTLRGGSAGNVDCSGNYGPRSVYVQGRYAYVANCGDGSIDVFDVSNPTSGGAPVDYYSTGSVGPMALVAQGRYLYATLSTNGLAPSYIATYDISNVSSINQVGSSLATSGGTLSLAEQGRYLFASNSNTFQIFDMGGEYAQQLEAGGIETGTLAVDGNASIGGSTSITGGLNVGQSAAIGGSLSVSGSITNQATLDTGVLSATNLAPTNFSTSWTGTHWTLTSTTAAHVSGAGNTNALSPTSALSSTAGDLYQVSYTVTSPSTPGSTLTVAWGSTPIATYNIDSNSSTFTDTKLITAPASGNLTFTPSALFTGTISAVSVNLVTQNTSPALVVNNVAGNPSLTVQASSSQTNLFIGVNAGESNTTTGVQNIALGYDALQSNTTGGQNAAIGYGALQNNTTGSSDLALGWGSLSSNTTGNYNTGLGYNTLTSNTTGSGNAALGVAALQNNTTGSNNAAFGNNALSANTSGSSNVAIGSTALSSNTTGNQNVAIGGSAAGALTSGANNAAIGMYSLYHATTASWDTAIGFQALQSDVGGTNNTGIGTGADVIYNATNWAPVLQNATAIGATSQVGASNNIILGYSQANSTNQTVGIGSSFAPNELTVSATTYGYNGSAGASSTITQNTGSSTVTINGGTASANMNGGTIYYNNGTTGVISNANGGTTFTSTNTTGGWTTATYSIVYGGFNVTSAGTAFLQPTTDSTTAFMIQNAANTNTLFTADTTDSKILLKSTSTTTNLLSITNNSVALSDVIDVTANSLSTGNALSISSSSSALAGGALVLAVDNSATTATGGLVQIQGNALTSGVALNITKTGNTLGANGALLMLKANSETSPTGGIAQLSATALTTGILMSLTTNGGSALTSGALLQVTANSQATDTNGIVQVQTNGLTTGVGTVLSSTSSGITNGSLLQVTANSATAPVNGIVQINGTSLTTGVALNLNVASGGTALKVSTGSIIDLASATNGNYTIMKIPTATTCTSGATQGLVFKDTSGQVAHICTTGTGSTFFATSFTNSSTDVAENYSDVNNDLKPGELVALSNDVTPDGIVAATAANQDDVIGVVSTDPGVLLSGISELNGSTNLVNPTPVALSGRIPTNVSTENGPIAVGDYLTISSIPGVAMKATSPGLAIGRALEAYDGSGVGSIEVMTSVGYYAGPDANSYVQNGGSASLADLSVNGNTALANLSVIGDTNLSDLNVSGPSRLSSLDVTGDANVQGNLTVQGSVNIGGSLTVTGLTTVADLVVSGHIITAGGQPTIQIQTAAGQVAANDHTGQPATATLTGNDTSGTITITTSDNPTAGDLLNISFSKAYTNTPHILISGQDGKSVASFMYPSDKTDTGFELHMDNLPQPNTTYTFDYFIVQ